MTIKEWIRNKEITSSPHFSVDELQRSFAQTSEQLIKNDLYRLKEQGLICSVYKGFYVIVPVQYMAKGVIPPLFYIDQLMAHISKPYYISLLNAAELLGVSHQAPQRFSVMTIAPKATVSRVKNGTLQWVYRRDIPEDFILTKNSETGIVRYSGAELTALDLVQYSQYIGGLSRATTVLSELVELTDFSGKIERLLNFTTLATLQRLGYILEEVLDETGQADILYSELNSLKKRLTYVPLSVLVEDKDSCKNKKWKININTQIEPDEL